jgi:hypothetical protein
LLTVAGNFAWFFLSSILGWRPHGPHVTSNTPGGLCGLC